MFLHQLDKMVQKIYINLHQLVNARPLHLDNNPNTISQLPFMHLSYARSGNRLSLKIRKNIINTMLQFFFNNITGVVVRKSADIILEFAELVAVFFRN